MTAATGLNAGSEPALPTSVTFNKNAAAGLGAENTSSTAHEDKPNRLLQYWRDFIGWDRAVSEATPKADLKGFARSLPTQAGHYVHSLFPITRWILHYNLTWFAGDLIAGLTVGIIVVPQSMSYAKIAGLPAEYGLYSSFIGVMIYALFATSRDVTIGPVAVMSLEVGKVISHVRSQVGGDIYSPAEIASALAFITGFIVLGIGLLRLGWLVEFVPAVAVSGFMTGSAITILAGQVPSLMGYATKFNTREATYKVIINSFKFLPSTTRDAAFGLVPLVFLYVVRYIFQRVQDRARNPRVRRAAFFANTMRSSFVIILVTAAAFGYLRNKRSSNYPISILKTVPSGFKHMGQPLITADLLSRMAPLIPVSTIILLLEHIAIAKSFGRINNYKIDPSQELIAIGVTNTLGTLFGAYSSTGSFSRSAVKAKAGVRTPLAGWITGAVVIIALYALTGAFYWIPNAGLSAIIIHAVSDLVASPKQVYNFWKISPLEMLIWLASVLASIFGSVEIGIYVSVAASVALMLFRIARPRGQFLGRVRLHAETGTSDNQVSHRDVYLPLNPDGVRNPAVRVEPPPPGVIVYRFEESFLFPNASFYVDVIADHAKKHTRSGQDYSHTKTGDRPWNDPGPLRWKKQKPVAEGELSQAEIEAQKPILRAIVLDFSSVSNVDTTSVQNLVDLRRVVERYAGGEVQFHFASILTPWIKRALLAGGFGRAGEFTHNDRPVEIAAVVPEHTDAIGDDPHFRRRFPISRAPSPPTSPPNGHVEKASSSSSDVTEGPIDLESGLPALKQPPQKSWSDMSSNAEPVVSTLSPRFHLDLSSAVAVAIGSDW